MRQVNLITESLLSLIVLERLDCQRNGSFKVCGKLCAAVPIEMWGVDEWLNKGRPLRLHSHFHSMSCCG